MVLVSHKHKFIFVKSIKTAGSSTEGLFEKYCTTDTIPSTHKRDLIITDDGIIGSRLDGEYDSINNKWRSHMSAMAIKDLLPTEFDEYYKFTIIRNPWDKLVSMWFMKIGIMNHKNQTEEADALTFEKFIVQHFYSLDYYLYHINAQQVCNKHIRFENLTDDLQEVADYLELPDFDISDMPSWKSQYRNDSGAHYSTYYTNQSLIDRVAKIYSREIAEFGYTFDTP
jgi:hypothetical protein